MVGVAVDRAQRAPHRGIDKLNGEATVFAALWLEKCADATIPGRSGNDESRAYDGKIAVGEGTGDDSLSIDVTV